MGNKNSGLKQFDIPFKLNDEESLYWLGYICADGNVYYSKQCRSYTVSLFSKDIDIIKKFMDFIGPRCKYHLRKQNGIHQAYICSIQLCKFLISLNIVPNKSLILDPKIRLSRHFLRGYFDGDGSIRNSRKECKITTGSVVFKDKICKYLNNLNIYYKVRTWGNAFYINLERKDECIKFLHHLYKDSQIYLDRKYQQYVALTSNS